MYLNGTKCCFLVLCCILSLSVTAKDKQQTTETGGLRKPLCFIENKGQILDQNNNTRHDVQYKLSAPGMNLFVGNGQLHYQFRKNEGSGTDLSFYRMDVTLLGANKMAMVEASEKQEYYENYYLSYAAKEGVSASSYNKITYKNVYPSIDWVIYVKDSKVEYDFVVRPGGNVNDIKVAYGGATNLQISKDGGLVATTPMGKIEEKTPYAYETLTGKAVASSFKLNKNIVSFETGNYTGSVTIDPYLSWSTYYGGAGQDVVTAIQEDANSVSYVCGFTSSNAGIATVGAFKTANAGGAYDMFMAKYSAAGALQYATYFGGANSDQANCIALDNAGGGTNIYVAGNTNSPQTGPNSFSTFGAYHGNNNGAFDGFIIKFNNAGTRTWSTFWGGAGNDYINGIAVDAAGTSVYVTGQTSSATQVATAGAYQTALSGSKDAFISKFSSAGNIQWSTYYGGSAQDSGIGIACDPLGNVNIIGTTSSAGGMFTAGAYKTTISGPTDAFLAHFSTAGARLWATYYGGTGNEQGNAVACDGLGNIAIVGNTTSPNNIASARAFQSTYGGIQDAFIGYFSNNGTFQWGSYFGGPAIDYGQAVCFDLNKNIVVGGGTFSTSGIATTNSTQAALGGDYDAYLVKINPLGQLLWNTYFGGLFYDYANGVACDPLGRLTVAGYTSSAGNYGSGGLSTVGAQQVANSGGIYDGFVAKYKVDTFVIIPQPYTDTIVCSGGSLNVNYTVFPAGASFAPGNVFTVQMSNSSGSFAAPVTIGTIAATASGSVPCTLPAVGPGTGYRIRILASNPGFVSPDDYLNIQIVSSMVASTATSNTPVCVGGTINLFDTAPYVVSSWSWSGPNSFSSTLQNPTIGGVILAAAGIYSVTAVHNGCPGITSTTDVVVNNTIPPTPSVGFSAACLGSTLSLTASPDTTAPGITWSWTGPAGFTSTLQNPVITGVTAANAGTYYVSDNLAGCTSAQRSDVVLVHPTIPVATTVTASPGYTPATGGDTICFGTMVNFTSSVLNGGTAPAYQWYTGSSPVVGAISSTWSTATLTDGQVVYCVVNSNVVCPLPANDTSNKVKMNVIANTPLVYISASPGLHVTPGSTVTFTSTVYGAGTGPKYQWKKNNVAVAGATNTTFVLPAVNAPDTITLTVTSTMLCPVPDSVATSNMLIAESNVGVTSISAALSAIGLFPNPNSGTFTLRGSVQNSQDVSYEVTNLLGQVISKGDIAVNQNELNKTIELNNIADGIYIIHLSQAGQDKAFRFRIQRQ